LNQKSLNLRPKEIKMKSILSVTLLAIVMASTFFTECRAKDARKSPHETVKGEKMSVTYGRPYKKGRDVFGSLVPFGQVWRTGADEATEITFKKDVVLNGTPVKKGTYTLFTVPNKQQWEIILNSKLGQWGAYEYDKTKDVMRAVAQPMPLPAATEQFTITINGDGFRMEWDNVAVMVPVN
jgi:hypothetical protein